MKTIKNNAKTIKGVSMDTKTLKQITKMICKKNDIVLGDKVLVQCIDCTLSLYIRNSDVLIKFDYQVQASKDFTCLVQKKYIDLIPNFINTVEITNSTLKVNDVEFQCQVVDDDYTSTFKALLKDATENKVSYKALKSVYSSMTKGKDVGFPASVSFNRDKLVTTDGKRLSIYNIDTDLDCIISKEVIDVLMKIKKDFYVESKIELVHISVENICITTSMLTISYPSYQRVIPNYHDFQTIEMNDVFKKALLEASKYCKAEKTERVYYEDGQISVKDKSGNILYQKQINDDTLKFAFNYKFVSDLFPVIEDGLLYVNDRISAIVATDKANDNFLYLFMPIWYE